MFTSESTAGMRLQVRLECQSFFFVVEGDSRLYLPWHIFAGVRALTAVVRCKTGLQIAGLSGIEVGARCTVNQDVDVMEVCNNRPR